MIKKLISGGQNGAGQAAFKGKNVHFVFGDVLNILSLASFEKTRGEVTVK